jgi:uncharacterized protein YjiS (DUF1127 family)
MTHLSSTTAPLAGLPSGLMRRLTLVLRRQVNGWYDRHLQRVDLSRLDDYALRDIGISPADVRRECTKPFWR